MAIIKQTSYSGDRMTSTLAGNIEINDGTGEIIIRKGSNVSVRINSEGLTFSEPNGRRRIRLGEHPRTQSVGEWISKPNVDVIDELEG